MSKNQRRNTLMTLVIILIGILLGSLISAKNIDDSIFLLINIPILLAGYLLPIKHAVAVSVAIPLINILLFKSGSLQLIDLLLIIKYITYASSISYLNRKKEVFEYISILVAVLLGQMVLLGTTTILSSLGYIESEPILYLVDIFKRGYLGLGLQIVIIPGFIFLLNKYTTINVD